MKEVYFSCILCTFYLLYVLCNSILLIYDVCSLIHHYLSYLILLILNKQHYSCIWVRDVAKCSFCNKNSLFAAIYIRAAYSR